jgi:hypothetical protein
MPSGVGLQAELLRKADRTYHVVVTLGETDRDVHEALKVLMGA